MNLKVKFPFRLLILLFFITNTFTSVICQEISFPPEKERFIAMQSKDSVNLERLLHPDLIYSHSNGMTEDKQKHIHNIMSGFIEYKQIDNEDFKIRSYDNMTLTNGIIKVKGIINKSPFEVRLLYSAVYVKYLETWKLINWQSTKLN